MKLIYLMIGVIAGIILGVNFGPQITMAIYSIPPTNAWQNMTIIDPISWPNDTLRSIEAISYRDIQYWTSDGSIEFNFTTYP